MTNSKWRFHNKSSVFLSHLLSSSLQHMTDLVSWSGKLFQALMKILPVPYRYRKKKVFCMQWNFCLLLTHGRLLCHWGNELKRCCSFLPSRLANFWDLTGCFFEKEVGSVTSLMQSFLFTMKVHSICFSNHGRICQEKNLKAVIPVLRSPDSLSFGFLSRPHQSFFCFLLISLLLSGFFRHPQPELQLMLSPKLWDCILSSLWDQFPGT